MKTLLTIAHALAHALALSYGTVIVLRVVSAGVFWWAMAAFVLIPVWIVLVTALRVRDVQRVGRTGE